MEIRRVRATTEQLGKLMSDLATLPAFPTGEHLSDEIFVEYTMQMLDASEVQRVETHLASCHQCAVEMERLLDASHYWQSRKKRLAKLRAQVRAQALGIGSEPSGQPSFQERVKQILQEITSNLQTTFQKKQQPALAADTQKSKSRQIWQYQSPEGFLRGRAALDSRGDVTFRFTSKEMGLLGSRFRLCWGPLRREVHLKQVSPTEVGARVVILSHERPNDWTDIVLEMAE